ncbi:MAG: hypothetical protein AAGN35_07170 [Bacteroidota bacterium]
MIPGQASHGSPTFPEPWCGLWKDSNGKLLYLQRITERQLVVSLTPGHEQPFFPLPEVMYGRTHRLPALYQADVRSHLFLRVDAGQPGWGPYFELEFLFGEGDRLRLAEPWDLASGVIARPRINFGPQAEGSPDGTSISWAYPLANFWKAEEEEKRFLDYLGEISAD